MDPSRASCPSIRVISPKFLQERDGEDEEFDVASFQRPNEEWNHVFIPDFDFDLDVFGDVEQQVKSHAQQLLLLLHQLGKLPLGPLVFLLRGQKEGLGSTN